MANPKTINVGITQMTCSAEAEANEAKQAKLLEDAARKGAQIICTQEIYRGQYFCQVEDHRFFDTAEPIPGPSTDRFSKIAKEFGVVIVASCCSKSAPAAFTTTRRR